MLALPLALLPLTPVNLLDNSFLTGHLPGINLSSVQWRIV